MLPQLNSWLDYDEPLKLVQQMNAEQNYNNLILKDNEMLHNNKNIFKKSDEFERQDQPHFADKIFNGLNGQELMFQEFHPTRAGARLDSLPPTLPSYTLPGDYKFYPQLEQSSIRVSHHGDPHRESSDDQIEARSFTRESHYDRNTGAGHFSGFSDNSLLSQVGRTRVNSRYPKSINPPAQHQNTVLDFTEPLFYPERPLTPPSRPDRSPNIRAPPTRPAVPGPTRAARPGPQFQVTQSYTPSPLPHHSSLPGPRPSPAPGLESYHARPVSYSPPGPEYSHLQFSHSTPAPHHHHQYSPTPYHGYSHSSDRSLALSQLTSPDVAQHFPPPGPLNNNFLSKFD